MDNESTVRKYTTKVKALVGFDYFKSYLGYGGERQVHDAVKTEQPGGAGLYELHPAIAQQAENERNEAEFFNMEYSQSAFEQFRKNDPRQKYTDPKSPGGKRALGG